MNRSIRPVGAELAVALSATALILAAAPVFACGGIPGQANSALIITEHDSGKAFSISAKTRASLRLSHQEHWSPPQVQGTAIQLVGVEYFRDPGFSEWTIHVVHAGTATITSTGEPNCPAKGPCTGTHQKLTVTIVVRKSSLRHPRAVPTH